MPHKDPKDPEGKAPQPKRSILEYPEVLEAFHRPPVRQNWPSQIQQDPPPPQQRLPSPEERWRDPDEFLASSDLYLAQVPSSTQKRESSSSDSPTISTPTKSQQPPNEPDDKDDIQKFIRSLERKRQSPSALNRKPKSSHRQRESGPASPPSQANFAEKGGLEGDSSSQQQKPYNLRLPPSRRAPKEKDPPDLDFREDHFG